jgi:organic hydroperoxide reductase OsmC/OhrA
MGAKQHRYETVIHWTGNQGTGTSAYREYKRDHVLSAGGKPDVPCSSDPAFRGDPARYNPEELLVASLSACHMLWYLHLCAERGVVVTGYADAAFGTMIEDEKIGGYFTEVTLRPVVTIERGDAELARELHHDAHRLCFIANSVKFAVKCQPVIEQGHSHLQQ